jgi:hypothetical protein
MNGNGRSELEKRIILAEEYGQKWAELHETYRQLEELKKSVLADLQNALNDGDMSEAKLERLARSSKEWKEFIRNMCTAEAVMLKAKVRYDAGVAWYEACRTAESTNRVRMQVLRDTE